MTVTGARATTSLCPNVIVCAGVVMERDVGYMEDEGNPIPSLLDDENGEWA
jgi:hypothetical protein